MYMDALTASKILKDDNTTVAILCNLASCMIYQNQYDSALTILQQALNLQPNYARALERRAFVYNAMGKIEKAQEDLINGINNAKDKNLEDKMKEMLRKNHFDLKEKKEMYKKMIEVKKNIVIPTWITKSIKLLIVPFTWISNLGNMCKRKRS